MMERDQLLPPWLTGTLVTAAFASLTALELFRSLRRSREPKPVHLARNLTIAAIGGAVVSLAEQPVVAPLARHGARRNRGLTQALPHPVQGIAAVLLMDYTLYIWHVLTHKVPLLWRFHLPHHIDLDCDASTALRFHFGELLLSVPFRVAQIAVLGVSLREYSIWQTLVMVSILFHHSNVELPPEWDRRLSYLIVTPRMHGIHHDAARAHTDSNWSSGLSLWDRIHGTLRLDVPQQEVTTGVPAYQNPEDITFRNAILAPFQRRRDDWTPVRDHAGRGAKLSG